MISSSVNKPILALSIFLMFTLCVPFTLFVPGTSAVPVMDIDYPLNANAEHPVPLFVNVTSGLPVDEVLLMYENPSNGLRYYEEMNLTSGNETNGTWYYAIPSQTYKGSLNLNIVVSDISGVSASHDFIITLEGPEPYRPFPWNIVIIVAFLAITLVATELIFKPGLYRKTGRQKARELEEEDRRKELEEQGKE